MGDKMLKLEVYADIHRKLKRLAFETDIHLKNLTTAILHEALKDEKMLTEILKKLRANERYYEAET